eukprot:9307021-Prorocentrum_lima.AAC.1
MTSSLVGSEMCIRDRFCTARRLPPAVLRLLRLRCGGRSRTLAMRCTCSVSYTHLTLPTNA